ncbi:metalloregulator ArsR/SmtB family transcription factor [Arachnia propionica]|uniref:helix-turn-helix transcriptional regulator n=1 Tax=Arachnia propionica TaxID=1750 RepID=UPI001639C29D|nr:helix-turn-helix domain-containing protein [Arachnia propionica]
MTRLAHGLGPTRAKVLAVLQTSAAPVTITEVAGRLDLHPNSSRFHLEALVSSGYAARGPAATEGPGRPPTLYHATTRAPELQHTHFVELTETLLGQIRETAPEPEESAKQAGQLWGRRLASRDSSAEQQPEETITDLVTLLGQRGFTAFQDEGTLCFLRCPFRNNVDPELLPLVCAVHQGLLEGFLSGSRVACGELVVGEDVCHVPLRVEATGV